MNYIYIYETYVNYIIHMWNKECNHKIFREAISMANNEPQPIFTRSPVSMREP